MVGLRQLFWPNGDAGLVGEAAISVHTFSGSLAQIFLWRAADGLRDSDGGRAGAASSCEL